MRKWNPGFIEEIQRVAEKDQAYQQAKLETASAEPTPKNQETKTRGLSIKDGVLYRKEMLWVPEQTVQQILESEHDTKVDGHMG